jgi:hypothetical protein
MRLRLAPYALPERCRLLQRNLLPTLLRVAIAQSTLLPATREERCRRGHVPL